MKNLIGNAARALALLLLLPSGAFAFSLSNLELEPEVGVRGWFLAIDGQAVDTDLRPLGFNDRRAQPEFWARIRMNDSHEFEVRHLRIDRTEEATASIASFGGFVFNNDFRVDVGVEYFRLHYGYGIELGEWLRVTPFLELGILDEHTIVENRSTNQTNESDETLLFPLPGAEILFLPNGGFHPYARFAGVGLNGNQIIDFEGGGRFEVGIFHLGLGYRQIELKVNNKNGQGADILIDGIVVSGGFLF